MRTTMDRDRCKSMVVFLWVAMLRNSFLLVCLLSLTWATNVAYAYGEEVVVCRVFFRLVALVALVAAAPGTGENNPATGRHWLDSMSMW